MVVGLRLDEQASQLDELIAQLAQLAITVLFPLLAADLSWGELSPLGWGGVACVLALMLYRWLVIQIGGLGLPSLAWRHKLMLSWIAPRGIVTAAVASLFALELEAAGIAGAGALKGLVFLAILLTVGIQGFTAGACGAGGGGAWRGGRRACRRSYNDRLIRARASPLGCSSSQVVSRSGP